MNNKGDTYYLSLLLRQMERTFARGASKDWSSYDFEKLSDAVYDRAQVRLSVTTLKRVFGRLKYDSAPTLSTLNALAQYAAAEDWQAFKLGIAARESEEDGTAKVGGVNEAAPAANGLNGAAGLNNAVTPGTGSEVALPAGGLNNVASSEQVVAPGSAPADKTIRPWKSRWMLAAGAAGLIGIAALLVFFLPAKAPSTTYDAANFEFSLNKVIANGVPNSVIFNYAAREKPDSLFIVQTWDMSRRTRVSPDQHAHSAIYYYPGYFNTKLIANDQVVKTQGLWITSNGWLCLLEHDPAPVYFKKEDCEKDGVVAVTENMLADHASLPPLVRFFNQRDMGLLMSDHFTFETMVKNDFDDGSNACHQSQVLIQCKDDVIIIPLADKSCVGDLVLYFCGYRVESKFADLSGFGCDLTEWTSLRVETVGREATIYVNNKKAHHLTFPNKPAGIVGVQYRFNGAAAVKETRFEAGARVYEMD
ncbi:hypothetical protein MKQ68_03640 [Chitinophaga horti]|uniref:DUF4115 domain-containing protein n=1 Tax=Chitinophaga horti TaxID=2920382 RepID=A0ABY6J3M6_9BACT|nr:hypothetical protein [Chitinophaga horti]UYQ94183.1 hypothetical protein MKQ68_03640 [Chitinophaga horti]